MGEITYFTQEKRYIHRSGEIVWGMLSMSLVRDQTTRQPLYFISATVHIGPRKQAEQRLSFLADASKELAAGLDYRTTLQRVADTMVPHMADWCVVTTVGEDNRLEQVAVAHVDPAKVQWARDLSRRNPTELERGIGVARVIRTGEAVFYPEIADELLVATARDEEELRLIRRIGLNSIMIVPLQARDRVVGALTLIWSDSGHHYTAADLVFAEELGHRAAVAIDNAHLFETVRRAEQQQAELLTELEALFANAPIGIAFFNQHLEFVRVNESLAHWGGVPVAALLERRVQEALADLAPQIEPRIHQVFASGEGIFGVELCGHVPSDPDRQFYWYASWYPIVSEGGKPRHVGMMLVDITAQKENEQALRESEERYRATFDKAAVGVAHTHIDGRWLQVNDRLCEILGYSRAELLQMSFPEMTHPDDLSTDLDGVRRLVAGEIDGYRMEKRYFRKDGMIVWVNLSVSLVRQPSDGDPAYFIAMIEDISAQKRTQTRLQLLAETGIALSQYASDNESLQTMAELLVPRLADWCAINIVQPTGRIELVANAYIDPAKQTQIQEFADRYPLDLEAEQGTPSVIRNGKPLLYRVIPSELTTSSIRLQQLHALGLSSLIIVPLQARGRVLGAMTLARSDPELSYTEDDLSFAQELAQPVALTVDSGHLYAATRDAEARLRQLNESLEERVAARTIELERSNRELDQFAYVASHDLKAPLRAIANLAAWIESDSGAVMLAASREHLAKLRGRTVRMERLLDDMLTYARVGRNETAYRYVDTRELVHELTDWVAPATFEVSIVGDMPVVYTQRAPLETILRNLIDNAVKHHDKPTGHIRIAAREQDKFVEFSVADDGPGIPPQYHERIFEMFQTLQPRDQVEGSGIGLAIVKKILENQGGKIVVESEEGKGAQFTIFWPIMHPEDAT